METPKLIPVRMVRDNLDHLPQFALPAGFTLRWYEPGDAESWRQIQAAADQHHAITPALFEREFGTDESRLRERQSFLCTPEGRAVGTATAWFNDNYHGRPSGRVHWVAIVPDLQGRGLAKPLMTAVCNRLHELHHLRAYLVTETIRVPAINLYLKFGFVPEVRTTEDLAVWSDVQRQGLKIQLPDRA